MNKFETLFNNFHLITLAGEGWGLVEKGALGVNDGKIAWLGKSDEASDVEAATIIDGGGKFLSPALIDCHTHLVYGGNRADEWQMRLSGTSYEEIARAGGGILSTVNATRSASEDELFEVAAARLKNFLQQGATTFEIKSGYGLDVESELKMLRVARRLGDAFPVQVHSTLLGAHAVPPEFKGNAGGYIDVVVNEMIPGATGLATAVDVFTESIAFDLKQTERVFAAAKDAGLAIKIHAEQLSNMGGARLAAEMGALSADHLEYLDEAGVDAMSRTDIVATLLPGAFYFLKESQKPPTELLQRYGVPIALATDANPGSSPVSSILLMANMGCTFFGLTPSEAIRGLTVNAAKALGVGDKQGMLEVGMAADLASWNIRSPAELAFSIGHNPCVECWHRGTKVEPLI